MHLQRRNQHCTGTFILSVLFCSEIKTRFTLCMRYTLCAGGPSLGAKSRVPDDFPQKIFPTTPPGNGNVGILSVLFCSEIKMRYFVHALYFVRCWTISWSKIRAS